MSELQKKTSKKQRESGLQEAASVYSPVENVKDAGVPALKAVLKILDKWGCSSEQAQAILRLPKATYYRYKTKPELANITGDLLERLSYLLNIHASLRTVFSNPENLYGFMQMPNNNNYFNGASPIKVLEEGSFASLYEVFKRVDALKAAS